MPKTTVVIRHCIMQLNQVIFKFTHDFPSAAVTRIINPRHLNVGHVKCANVLIKNGANVFATNKKEETTLHVAAANGNLEF